MGLLYCNFKQSEKLRQLGYDVYDEIYLDINKAYDKHGNDINWTTKHFYCWKPPISLALQYIRNYHKIYLVIFPQPNKDSIIEFIWRVYQQDQSSKMYWCDEGSNNWESAESAGLDYILGKMLK